MAFSLDLAGKSGKHPTAERSTLTLKLRKKIASKSASYKSFAKNGFC
jgi:hypothetical protein